MHLLLAFGVAAQAGSVTGFDLVLVLEVDEIPLGGVVAVLLGRAVA